jgi:hypothetical protein
MMKKSKVMLIGIITAMFLALPLAAQNYDLGVVGNTPKLSSNTKSATAGIFSTDVDNFIDYHKYSGVKFDNGFTFLTGRPYSVSGASSGSGTGNPGSGQLSLGLAHDFGGLYLGAWYQGNILQSVTGDKTVNLSQNWDDVSEELLSTTQTTTFEKGWHNSNNQIELLLGLAGHGIKLGFLESRFRNKHKADKAEIVTDYQDGRVTYADVAIDYANKGGTFKPYLGWGTNMELAGGNMMPYLDLSMDIVGDTLVGNYSSYTTFNGNVQGGETTNNAGHNNGSLNPVGTIGFKFDLPKEEKTQVQLGLSYKINLTLMNNDYEASGFSGDKVKGKVDWTGYVNNTTEYLDRKVTATEMTLKVAESTNMAHAITPLYKITGEPVEGFRLGFSAQLPIGFGNSTKSNYIDKYTVTRTEYNDGRWFNESTTSHSINPDLLLNRDWESSWLSVGLNLSVGASYKLIPDRFTINTGISASPTVYTHSVDKSSVNGVREVETTKNEDYLGNVTEDVTVTSQTQSDQVTVSDTWAGFTGTLRAGFMFNFTSKAAVDMYMSASTNSFTISLTDVNVLFSIKY